MLGTTILIRLLKATDLFQNAKQIYNVDEINNMLFNMSLDICTGEYYDTFSLLSELRYQTYPKNVHLFRKLMKPRITKAFVEIFNQQVKKDVYQFFYNNKLLDKVMVLTQIKFQLSSQFNDFDSYYNFIIKNNILATKLILLLGEKTTCSHWHNSFINMLVKKIF